MLSHSHSLHSGNDLLGSSHSCNQVLIAHRSSSKPCHRACSQHRRLEPRLWTHQTGYCKARLSNPVQCSGQQPARSFGKGDDPWPRRQNLGLPTQGDAIVRGGLDEPSRGTQVQERPKPPPDIDYLQVRGSVKRFWQGRP